MAKCRKFGYCRVSSKDQNLDRQLDAMYAVGVDKVFSDKQSGKTFERPDYIRMMKKIKQGDVLFVKSIDRLGRNYNEILEQWREITKVKQCDIVVLDMPILDTRKDKNLMGSFVCDIVLQILSFVAENERTNIRQRQAEGIAAAKSRGIKFGRPTKPLPDEFEEIVRRQMAGEITVTRAARMMGMAISSYQYRAKKMNGQILME